MKMVIDFYRQKSDQKPIDLGELFEKAIDFGGTNEKGDWYHSTLVRTAKSYGFLSWRRSWKPADRDKDFFKKEGVDEASILRWEEQMKRESMTSLIGALKKGTPVIVSVAKNFNEIKQTHYVVLTGAKYSKDVYVGLNFNDPYANPTGKGHKDRYIPFKVFENNWTFRAIFVEPR